LPWVHKGLTMNVALFTSLYVPSTKPLPEPNPNDLMTNWTAAWQPAYMVNHTPEVDQVRKGKERKGRVFI